MNILQDIVARTKERVEEKKKKMALEEVIKAAMAAEVSCHSFERAICSNDIAFICEAKKASPSKGIISDDYRYLDIATEYEAAGAAAVSVLTEPYYFKGDERHLREIADAVSIPLLRKDFIIDDYMIYESRALGASAILLICSILGRSTLAEYITIAHDLGLSVLAETHNEKEIKKALSAGARIIGVNNRDLETFEVDIALSEKLRKKVPPDILFVAESGISSPKEVERLRRAGVNAVLIGETVMRSTDKQSEISRLRGHSNGEN